MGTYFMCVSAHICRYLEKTVKTVPHKPQTQYFPRSCAKHGPLAKSDQANLSSTLGDLKEYRFSKAS